VYHKLAPFPPSTYSGLPLPWLLVFNKHTVSGISTNPEFSIEAIKSNSGAVINPGDSFSYKFNIPLSARGGTTLPDTETVWVVVRDESVAFYLQYPPVTIRSGHWVATGIYPREGIKRIVFSRVGLKGNAFFQSKFQRNEWGKFNTMPSDVWELAFVELE